MKSHLQSLLAAALRACREAGEIAVDEAPDPAVERSRDPTHGDYASPLALTLARAARRKPREIAAALVARLPASTQVARTEIAGPGFINFFLTEDAVRSVVREVLERGAAFGRSRAGGGTRVQVEFVSANPTGPLHVGHGRGAAYGASLANLLDAAGFDVQREYYVNDAGRQMHILAVSVWLRYLDALGEKVPFPAGGYRGAYVRGIAARLAAAGADYRVPAAAVVDGLPADSTEGGDADDRLDALVERARALLGEERYRAVYDVALESQVEDIRDDLSGFGVDFDEWYSERSLVESGAIERAIARLEDAGHVYREEGALWFRSSALGDEKDRVVVRENGQSTYFASDIAYLAEKFARGFEHVIYVWGADHHGYVARLAAACEALGFPRERMEVLLVQFAVLYRGGEKVQMSTRSGEFVTLRELREEVGEDAARFFYVMRRCDQHVDFDLDLAKSQSADNPVYYLQYAHARICSVFRQAAERGYAAGAQATAAPDLAPLVETHELALMRELVRFPEVVESAARAREPHQVASCLREIANAFHAWYNSHTFLVDDVPLRAARLALAGAVRQVLANGLALLGVSAPETM